MDLIESIVYCISNIIDETEKRQLVWYGIIQRHSRECLHLLQLHLHETLAVKVILRY